MLCLKKQEELILNRTKKINFLGRIFLLEIVYDYYTGEKVSREQKIALKNFFKHPEWLNKSKIHVENYCREFVDTDDENLKKDNIFSYIKPTTIYVSRYKNLVAIMCKYRYDLEHGLAIVFDQDGNVTVGIQDIIL